MLGARGEVRAELCSAQGEERGGFWVLPKYHQSLEAPAGLSTTSCPPGAGAAPGAVLGGELVRKGQREALVRERRVLVEAFTGGKVSEQKGLLAVLGTCSWCWGVVQVPCPHHVQGAAGPRPSAPVAESTHLRHRCACLKTLEFGLATGSKAALWRAVKPKDKAPVYGAVKEAFLLGEVLFA